MPRLSLYLDEATLKMVERAARTSSISVSRWIRNRATQSLKDDWPDEYFALFGAIKDDTFAAPEEFDGLATTPRGKP